MATNLDKNLMNLGEEWKEPSYQRNYFISNDDEFGP